MKKAVGQRIEWLKGFESFKNVSQRELFKRATEWMKGEVEKFQAEFHKSGDVSQCPDYVYFLGE
jgi:hypothetical protein